MIAPAETKMGTASSHLTPDELQELQDLSFFTVPEITRLYKRFKTLDRENRATVSRAELLGIPELAMNPLAQRILSVFDDSQGQGLGGDLNFRQFLTCLSAFSPAAKRDVKLKFAFQVYDVNGDGFIDNQDLCTIVKLMVGSNFSHDQVQTIVDQTILDADTLDVDGRISFDEFKRAMFAADLESILTISV